MLASGRKLKRRLELLGRKLDHAIESRPCDGCTACCTVLGVEEFGKPMGAPCVYEGAGCCSIYSTRPPSCQDFFCVWRQGIGTTEDRPDKVGIVLDHARRHVLEGKAILAREVWPGAFTDAGPFLLRLVQRGLVVFLVSPAGKLVRVMGPEPKILALKPILEQMRRENREEA